MSQTQSGFNLCYYRLKSTPTVFCCCPSSVGLTRNFCENNLLNDHDHTEILKNVNFSLKFLDYFVPSILTLTHLIIQLSNVSRCQPVDNDQMRFFEIFDFLKYECHQGSD